jgi:lambda family phage portal protein
MKLLKALGSLLGIKATFESAMTTSENARHWRFAKTQSADAALPMGDRIALRDRCKYEVRNNCYAAGIVATLAHDVVGSGPRLQVRLKKDKDLCNEIEKAWRVYARDIQLAQKLRTMRRSIATDGEAFMVLASQESASRPVKLDPRLIESEQVGTPLDIASLDPSVIDGIEVDDDGYPVAYRILRGHPGDTRSIILPHEFKRVPASDVIHYFRPDRPGQHRGYPDLAPCLPLFAQLRRFTLAVLTAAEVAASHSGVIQTTLPSVEVVGVDAGDQFELNRNEFKALPEGWELKQMQAEQPVSTYGEFKREILNEIARRLGMPYNIAAGNSSSYNYASGRLDHQTYDRMLAIEREDLERIVLQRLFAAWAAEAVLLEDSYLSRAARAALNDSLPMAWLWPLRPHVDPEKEANAQKQRLLNGTTTLRHECAMDQRDFEDVLAERAEEVAAFRKAGIPVLGDQPLTQEPKPGTAGASSDSNVNQENGS